MRTYDHGGNFVRPMSVEGRTKGKSFLLFFCRISKGKLLRERRVCLHFRANKIKNKGWGVGVGVICFLGGARLSTFYLAYVFCFGSTEHQYLKTAQAKLFGAIARTPIKIY